MITIDLHDYYPHEPKGSYIEVSEAVAAGLKEFVRQEVARQVKEFRYKAYYSLDLDDGIETCAFCAAEMPAEILEHEYTKAQILAAINNLSDKQAKRVLAHYIDGWSIPEIARREGVNERSVRRSMERSLSAMAEFLKKVL